MVIWYQYLLQNKKGCLGILKCETFGILKITGHQKRETLCLAYRMVFIKKSLKWWFLGFFGNLEIENKTMRSPTFQNISKSY